MGVPRPTRVSNSFLALSMLRASRAPLRRLHARQTRRTCLNYPHSAIARKRESRSLCAARNSARPVIRPIFAAAQILRDFNGYANLSCPYPIADLYFDLQLVEPRWETAVMWKK